MDDFTKGIKGSKVAIVLEAFTRHPDYAMNLAHYYSKNGSQRMNKARSNPKI